MNWVTTLQITVIFVLFSGVFAPIIPPMVDTWLNHSDNSHALLVPFICLYFIWVKRGELGKVEINSSGWGGLFLTSCLAVYLLSYIGAIAFVSRLMFVGALIGLIWACFGWLIVRVLAFPLGFLVFMVPIPFTFLQFVSFPLQLQATKISAWVIGMLSIPVYREGNMLYFVQTQLEVAEACSGIRSIMALVMLSVLLAYMSDFGKYRSILLTAFAIPVALFANILRVSGTGILAHFYGDEVARGFLHDFSGLIVFVFGFLVIISIAKLLPKTSSEKAN